MQTPSVLSPALLGRPSPLDVDALLAWHHRVFGDTRMGPDGDEGDEGGGDDKAGGEKKFSQADLDRIAAREKDQGKRAGASEAHKSLMRTLGLPEDTKPDDVKAVLDRAKKAELDAMSETDRAKAEAKAATDAAAAAQKAADQARADADAERHTSRVQSLLERAGVGAGKDFEKDGSPDEDKVAKALARAAKLLEVEVGADSDDIRKAIAGLKKDMPALFGSTTRTLPDGRPGGTPSGQRPGGESAKEAGRREAEKRGWAKPQSKSA